MLHYLRGRIAMEFEGGVVVETGGIGYKVYVPDNSPLYLNIGQESVLVYTGMIVREDDISLYGFPDQGTLELFQKLRTVNGVGAKAALAILSAMTPDTVRKSILFEDTATLTRANGIGKKTAQRIVLELKDKIGGGLSDLPASGGEVPSDQKEEAIDALIQLGYSRTEAAIAVRSQENPNLSTEEYIKGALRGISPK